MIGWWRTGKQASLAKLLLAYTEPMRSVHKTYVGTAGGQVHCRISDGAAPAILFLHQTASSSRSFDALMRRLALPNRLIAIDTPGFGESYDPPGWPTLRTYCRVVLEVSDALGINAFHLFGHHTGASLAVEIAASHPSRTRSIMLAGVPLMSWDERQDLATSLGRPLPIAADGAHLLENWSYAAHYNPGCDLNLLHQEVVAMLRARIGRAQAYSAVARHDTHRSARRVRCPVLLVTSADDFFHPMLCRALEIFEGARVARTKGGNFQPSADPRGVARAIIDFLSSLHDTPVSLSGH